MVRNYTLVLLSIAAVALCGCNKQETPSDTLRHTVTLRAEAAGSESTRNIFDVGGNFYWLKTDAIGLATVGGDGTTFSELKWDTVEALVKSGSFSGDIEGSVGLYAIYPYNAGHKLSDATLTYHLPATYEYTAPDEDYFSAGTKSYLNSANAPAYGAIVPDANGNLSTQFKHLGGVLCIKLDHIPASAGHITVTADRKIAGDFSVNLNDTTPQIKTSDDASSSTENTVTVSWSDATVGKTGVFYFPMPVGTCNVSVEVGYHSIGLGEMARVSKSREVVIERTSMKKVSLTYKTMAKDSYYIYGGHKFIDLGLDSGLLWAETNVGADNYYDCGNYYVWSETKTRDNYGKITSYSKYNDDDDKTVLDPTEDAASVNWGTYCRMPLKKDWKELHKCDKGSNANYYGRTYVGTNGNSIFLPAGGFRIDDRVNSSPYEGYYWCRDLAYAPNYPNVFVFNSDANSDANYTRIGFDNEDDAEKRADYRYKGYSIRPVVDFKNLGY